jgi:hypothetical protein
MCWFRVENQFLFFFFCWSKFGCCSVVHCVTKFFVFSISTLVIGSHISYLCLKKNNVGGIYQGTFHDGKSINCLLIMLWLNFLVFNFNKGSSFSLGLAFLFSFYSILFCYSLIVLFFFEWQIVVFLTMNTNWSCNIVSNIYGMRDIQGKGFPFLSL